MHCAFCQFNTRSPPPNLWKIEHVAYANHSNTVQKQIDDCIKYPPRQKANLDSAMDRLKPAKQEQKAKEARVTEAAQGEIRAAQE